MTRRGTWRDAINRQAIHEHVQWAHSQGGTRLVRQDCNLDDMPARGTRLSAARFERCTFRRADLSYSDLADLEMEDCVLNGASFVSSNMDRAHMVRCRLVQADLRITRLRTTDIVGCDFSQTLLDRADLKSAALKETSFRGAFVYDATLDDAIIGYCNWRNADLGCQKMAHLCTAVGTWFLHCDLRDTHWEGRRLQDARFTECRFYGIHGTPVIEGRCTIERPNMAAGDREEMGTAEQVLEMWKA